MIKRQKATKQEGIAGVLMSTKKLMTRNVITFQLHNAIRVHCLRVNEQFLGVHSVGIFAKMCLIINPLLCFMIQNLYLHVLRIHIDKTFLLHNTKIK